MPRSSDVEVARVSARQHTPVSVEQLRLAGLSASGIKWRAKSGGLFPAYRGVYSTVPPEHRPALAAEAAALLAAGPGSVLSHRSAAAMWGLVKRDPHTVDVLAPRQRRNRSGVRVHRAKDLGPRDVRTRARLPLTSPYRSIRDLAPHMRERELQQAVSEALSQRLIGDAEATTLVEDPRITRSEAERRFLELMAKSGLPMPSSNVRLHGFEVDFHWPQHNLVVEIDGFRYHRHRQAFDRDRRKALALECNGLRVLRISWRQLTEEPERVIASLARLLAA